MSRVFVPIEAEILERTIEPSFRDISAEFGRRLVDLKLSDEDAKRLHDLGARARAGTLTSEEDEELEAYLRIGHVLSIMRLKARQSLRSPRSRRGA